MMNRNPRQTVTQWSIAGLIVAGFLAFLAPLLSAQTFFGSIVGTVTDTSGAIVPGAGVTLTNTGTSERRAVQTDANGNYQFVNLVPGTYRLEIEATGFKRLTRDEVRVQVQAAVRIDAAMQVGIASETVEVTSQTPLLQTEQSSLSQVVEGRTVQDMPLNGRNVMNLIALVPGVVAQNGSAGNPMGNLSNGRVTNPVGWGNYQIGGGQTNQSAMFYDGVPVNGSYVNATVLVPVQDAVQEFRVASNSVSPEFGRFAGGVVNFTSKSGTNQFHGNAYEYFRNKVLNANNFFNNANGQPRPPFNQNQFGATVTGPVIKDKTFFMFSWEDFKMHLGVPSLSNVPTAAMRAGDFSDPSFPKIYDPLTVCGNYGNPACAKDANGNNIYVRQPFLNNKIPTNRINPTSNYMLYYWMFPNQPGTVNNFAKNGAGGGDQYQINTRVDYVISDKQRLFGRYTHLVGNSIPNDLFENGVTATQMRYYNHNIVVGDTYTLSPTTILDVRVAYMRFRFGAYQMDDHHDLCLYGQKWCPLNNQVSIHTFAAVSITGVLGADERTIRDLSSNETMSENLTKIAGRHTLKFGGEHRFVEWRHGEINPPGPLNNFTPAFTAQNPLSPAGSGVGFASFLLGDMASGSAKTLYIPAQRYRYHGLFLTDTFQASKKLTLNLGVRWEYPGSFYERNDYATVMLPTQANPLAQTVGLPLKGNIALVNSKDYSDRHIHPAKWTLFGPRVGLAYRMTDKTVIRAGYGISFLPNEAVLLNSPWSSPVNQATTTVTASLDGGITPYATLDNPYPNGLLQPPGRSSAYATSLYGTDVQSPVPDQPYPYMAQWNFTVQQEFAGGTALEVSYAGSKGTHMPLVLAMGNTPTFQMNQIPDQYLSMGTALLTKVPNPFYGKVPVTAGILAQPTIVQGQLLRPMPQYMTANNTGNMGGDSTYNSLQAKLEKRFKAGGSLLATYTFAKMLGVSDSTTSWTENYNSAGTYQDWTNLALEKSLSSYDSRHNFSLSYVLDLPVGKGKKFWSGVSGPADKLVSGWVFGGIVKFKSGFPLVLTAQPTTLSSTFGGGTPRPNVVAGCTKEISGSAQSRLKKWFNTACFTQPGPFAYGNESRTDPSLTSQGINNIDVSIYKDTAITEQVKVRFMTEIFNIANHATFMPPTTQLGNPNFGVVSNQRSLPRMVQFALRVVF
jgi:hypothetical protein